MITSITLDDKGHIRTLTLEEVAELLQREERSATLWIDLSEPTHEEEEEVLVGLFAFHPLAVLDCRRERLTPGSGDHFPKVEDYHRYLFAIINPVDLTEGNDESVPSKVLGGEVTTRQVNAFIGLDFIVTHHYEPSVGITRAMSSCEKNPVHLGRGPDFIYHLILDDIVDQFTPILDRFDDAVDGVEDEIFTGKGQPTLQKILALKRQIFTVRRIAIYQREMVHRLSRGEFELITQDEIAYYRNVYDHLARAAELAESYRDVLTSMLDAYLSTTSNRLNEIMKVLAIISTFFLPLTFIAGLYGMNFHIMPELEWRFGYPFALGLMAATATGMYLFFRRRGWL